MKAVDSTELRINYVKNTRHAKAVTNIGDFSLILG